MKTKGIWNFLKTIKGRSNISIPIIIIESTKNITSNMNIANIINSFFYTKVKNIINKFTTVDYDPLIFVRFLIPKPKAWLEIPYISNRRQYTDINTNKSVTITCLLCGVLLGSKLSGLLYTIYTNKVPLLQTIMENRKICQQIGAANYEELPVEHTMVNFIDDSNSVISAKPGSDMEKYLMTTSNNWRNTTIVKS